MYLGLLSFIKLEFSKRDVGSTSDYENSNLDGDKVEAGMEIRLFSLRKPVNSFS